MSPVPTRSEIRLWQTFFVLLTLVHEFLVFLAHDFSGIIIHTLGFIISFVAFAHVTITGYRE